jgi:exodeoxyribonuclease VII large subunit
MGISTKIAAKIYSVSELTRELKCVIENDFSQVILRGEISNLRSYASGHTYFTLKDENSQISAVMFKGYQKGLKFKLEDGQSIIAYGNLSVYEARGNYQLIVRSVDPDGMGALQLAFDQLKEKLQKEGLFNEDFKKPLPSLPQNIGIITSLQGAVMHDLLSVLKRRYPNINVLIYPSLVQGSEAAKQICEGISYFKKSQNVDVLIIARGGGSLEDLWPFNEEQLARAIASCQIPTISAVGHETDFTIADYVADVRAPTPSAAAEVCVPLKKDLEGQIEQLKSRLYQKMQDRLQQQATLLKYFVKAIPTPTTIQHQLLLKLADFENRLYKAMVELINARKQELWQNNQTLSEFKHLFKNEKQKIHIARLNLKNLILQRLKSHGHIVDTLQTKLNLLSPKQTLKRGYIMAKSPNGKLIKRVKQVNPQEPINLIFYDGEVETYANKKD